MIMSASFSLSYGLLNVILSPSKFISMKCCIVVMDVTFSQKKCYVTYGHNLIDDVTLISE